jgi:hypothetical protein
MHTKTFIEKYFLAEKAESLLFMFIGIAGILAGVYFLLLLKTNFYKGAAIPLIGLGLLLGIVGFTVYNRSDKDIAINTSLLATDKQQMKDKETIRMKAVMQSFVWYRYIQIFLVVTGIILLFYFPMSSIWKGIGMGLLIMGALALTADYFAEKRGKVYSKEIQNL